MHRVQIIEKQGNYRTDDGFLSVCLYTHWQSSLSINSDEMRMEPRYVDYIYKATLNVLYYEYLVTG